MRPSASFLAQIVTLLTVLATGCVPSPPQYLRQTNDLSYYIDRATDVAYPDVQTAMLAEATDAYRPITAMNPDQVTFEDLTLEDAISIALQNSKVIRGYGTPGLQGNVVSAGLDSLAVNPNGAGTVYNVAIIESEPGFFPALGSPTEPGTVTSNTGLETTQGVEAALAEFDAQYSGFMSFDKTDRPRNTVEDRANLEFDRIRFQQESLNITHQLSKKTAVGTQVFFRSVTERLQNNLSNDVQPLSSYWTQSFEAEIRQPLMRGRGTLVNRMPVVIARIQSDQELANLETQLQNMVCNVEIRYWDLQCAYRIFESAQESMNNSLKAKNLFTGLLEEAALPVTAYQQVNEQYYFAKANLEQAFNDLVDAENNLRWLMDWSPTDGRLVRPSDEPLLGYVGVNWPESLARAHFRRPELRLERWEIKKRELALAYARNSLLPQVNATALYRWLGSGDVLWGTNRNGVPFPNTGSRALEELTGGDYQEISLGFEINSSIGFRRELANVRNAQLKLARELARLEEFELDTTRELTNVVRAIDGNYLLAENNLMRYQHASAEADQHLEVFLQGGAGLQSSVAVGVNQLIDAGRRSLDAENNYHRAICEYNKSLALLQRRMGTTLEYNGVEFSEGAWPEKAYFDAEEHARRRSASRQINYGWTRPWVISQDSLGAVSSGAAPINISDSVPSEQREFADPTEYYQEGTLLFEAGDSVLEPTPAGEPIEFMESTTSIDSTIDSNRRIASTAPDSAPRMPSSEANSRSIFPSRQDNAIQLTAGEGFTRTAAPIATTIPVQEVVESQTNLPTRSDVPSSPSAASRSMPRNSTAANRANGNRLDRIWQRAGMTPQTNHRADSEAVIRQP